MDESTRILICELSAQRHNYTILTQEESETFKKEMLDFAIKADEGITGNSIPKKSDFYLDMLMKETCLDLSIDDSKMMKVTDWVNPNRISPWKKNRHWQQ